MPTSPRLAPTQKLRAWLAITSPAQRPLSSSSSARAPSSTTAASIALAWAVELEAEHPVAQVDQAGRAVAGHLGPALLQPVEVDDLGVGRDGHVVAGQRAVDLRRRW